MNVHMFNTLTFRKRYRVSKPLERAVFLAKPDVEAAFRMVPFHPDDYDLLGFPWWDLLL